MSMNNMYEYRIYKSVYDDMITGKKKVELRLLTDKSAKIKKDDLIRFKVVDDDKYLLVRVTDKYLFDNIDDLFKHKDIVLQSAKDYTKEELTQALYEIFGKDNVLNSKIVGIAFELE